METTPHINVLYVDDENNNLETFKANFRNDYNLFLASSGAEGLELLENNLIHIILADERMSQMSGLEFLKIARARHSNAMRIIISAYSDNETLKKLINQVSIFKCLSKPFEFEEIRLAIQEGYEFYTKREREILVVEEIKKNTDKITKLFNERDTLVRLIDRFNHPN